MGETGLADHGSWGLELCSKLFAVLMGRCICRTMGKGIDHHSVQILNISRFQQKLRAEEALAKLNQGGNEFIL